MSYIQKIKYLFLIFIHPFNSYCFYFFILKYKNIEIIIGSFGGGFSFLIIGISSLAPKVQILLSFLSCFNFGRWNFKKK